MQLYTFILDFRGGPYISQFKGETPKAATYKWAKKLKTKGIPHLNKKGMKSIIEDLDEDELVAIDTVKNVWCHSFLVKNHLALLNIITTSED